MIDAQSKAVAAARGGAQAAMLLWIGLALAACGRIPLLAPRTTDATWAPYATEPALDADEVRTQSFYVSMRDGVKLAVDLHLPAALGEGDKLPTVLHFTRYFRSYDVRIPFRWRTVQPNERVRRFLGNGYAWMDVDVRGSGASFGTQLAPWSPEEVMDYAEVVDWVLKQPWSDGKVGAWGRSYDGSAALMLLAQNHPAVKAVVPEFYLFDLYADVAYPGGIHLASFTEAWGELSAALDLNEVGSLTPGIAARLALRGVKPVDEDRKGRMLKDAVAQHAYNWNPHETALRAQFRDDLWHHQPSWRLDMFSPHGRLGAINQSGAAVYSYAGWFDGAYQRGTIHAHRSMQNPANRLVIGPWNHGGSDHVGITASKRTRFDRVADQIRFFDHALKGEANGIENEAAVHYYTLVEGAWKEATSWPPDSKPRLMYFGEGGKLSAHAPSGAEAFDEYRVDLDAGTGKASRWDSVLGGYPVKYADRVERDQLLLTYTSEPLGEDMEVTGHPYVTVYAAASAPDATFFVYLEDVTPEGEVKLVTEGQMRALHRKLSAGAPPYDSPVPYHTFERKDAETLKPGEETQLVFDLLPTSYLFRDGHRLRIAIAGADRDHFLVTPGPPPTFRVHRDALRPSHVVLPTMPRE